MRKARVLLAIADRATRQALTQLLADILPSELAEPPTGPDAYQAALAQLPDLVVASSDLTGYDGLTLCHMLRGIAQLQDTPVVILGPRGDQQRKYQAFYVGATEYVELPYDPLELQYRLRVQLRPLLRERDAAMAVTCGPLTLEPATRTVRVDGREAVLTPSEFSLMRHFAGRPGHPFSAEQLLTEALGHPPQLGNPQLIHTHLRNMRRKLEADPKAPAMLLRHPAGYMLALP
ncbi:MAG: response regulator transcription factor [Candidatus Sericytochromatia bacterium]